VLKNDWQRHLICCDLTAHTWINLRTKFFSVSLTFPWDHVWLNGDVADFSQLSSHDKIGTYERAFRDTITLDEELFFIKSDIFRPLRKAVKKAKITMRLGNHDSRYLSIAENNSAALAQLLKTTRKNRSLHLEDVLSLNKFNINLSYSPEDVIGGMFTLVHGVKTSKNVAKQNLLAYGNGSSGHSHGMGCYTETQRGTVHGWWESGCLRTVKSIECLPFGSCVDWSQGYWSCT
jgi:hypothetical protein